MSVLDTPESREEVRKRIEIYEPLQIYLCHKFIDRDQMRYNDYLRHV